MTEPPQNRPDANASACSADNDGTGVSLFLRLWAYAGPLQPLTALMLDREPEIAELIREILRDGAGKMSKHAGECLSTRFDSVVDTASAAKALQARFLRYRRKAEPKQVIPAILICSTQDAEMSGLDMEAGAATLSDILAKESSGQILVPGSIYENLKDAPALQFNSKPVREAGPSGAPEALYELLWTDESTYGHLRTAVLTRQTVGRYEIQRELGRGAMAAVYKAYDQVIGRTVALKVISIDLNTPDRADIMERLKREAQAAGKLDHPNIITIYDVGQDADVVYLSMQFLEGQTLLAYLAQTGAPALSTLISWADQISSAVGFAHAHGVIHRDLKPANLMLTNQGVIKVLDFGIAKIENATLTQTGLVVGTPSYMSPEQVAGKKIDHRTDIFALGSVFYELVTREKPFRGDVATILYKIVNEDPPAPSIINPALPGGIDAIIRKALAKNPNDRFQSCEEMRNAFLEQAAALNIAPQPLLPVSATVQKQDSRPVEEILAELTEEPVPQLRWRMWPAIAGVAVMALVATIGIALYAPSTFAHFPTAVRNVVARARHDVPSLFSNAVKNHGTFAEQDRTTSNEEPSIASSENHEPAATTTSSETPAGTSSPVPVQAVSQGNSVSSTSAQTASMGLNQTDATHAQSAGSESQQLQGMQQATESDQAKGMQPAIPSQQSGNDQPASETASESAPTLGNPGAVKPAVASTNEAAPTVAPTSTTKPHPKPRREAVSVDRFTRRDIPELLREADTAGGRGDYRLAIYSYNLILKLDPANATAKAGLRRVQAAQQSQ